MAERLTLGEAIKHCEEKIDCTQCGEEHRQLAEWLKELQHYKNIESQGRLVELQCKIGDTVYGRFKCYDGKEIRECKVIGTRACHFNADFECYYFVDVELNIIDPSYMDGRLMTCRHQAVIENDYGSWERVFFTREEAEEAK